MASTVDSSCSGVSVPCNQSVQALAPYSPEATAAFATAIILVVFFTIFGNIMVIIAVLTSRSLHDLQNLFLVSLAAVDILVGTLIIPFSLANELLGYWYFKALWCEIYRALDVLFCTSSILHLCAISLDRYLSISRVTYGHQRPPRCIKGAIVAVWFISAIISFPQLLSPSKSEEGDRASERGPQCPLIAERWYILYSTIGSFFAPCLIMILVYVRIYQIAKQRICRPPGKLRKEGVGCAPPSQPLRHIQADGKEVEDSTPPSSNKTSNPRSPTLAITHSPSPGDSQTSPNPTANNLFQPPFPSPDVSLVTTCFDASPHVPSPPSSAPQSEPKTKEEGKSAQHLRGEKADNNNTARHNTMVNREKRLTFVLAVVIGVFVVCWFPFFFSYFLKAVCNETCIIPDLLFTFFFWIGYCNSCLNPLIYTIFNKDFRKAFKKILCRSTKGTFF
uniref:Alpha-2B adrenergic receptor n=1 Tax=Kryptolebias marmoratus TaxID=37003 RepID=A0A3Q3A3H9_KRYMA